MASMWTAFAMQSEDPQSDTIQVETNERQPLQVLVNGHIETFEDLLQQEFNGEPNRCRLFPASYYHKIHPASYYHNIIKLCRLISQKQLPLLQIQSIHSPDRISLGTAQGNPME